MDMMGRAIFFAIILLVTFLEGKLDECFALQL
jgi:hypothetical protein